MKNNLVRFAFLIPLTIPSNAMAVVWKILFSDAGIVNNILVKGLHIEDISELDKLEQNEYIDKIKKLYEDAINVIDAEIDNA